jgi:hypothetical protein
LPRSWSIRRNFQNIPKRCHFFSWNLK